MQLETTDHIMKSSNSIKTFSTTSTSTNTGKAPKSAFAQQQVFRHAVSAKSSCSTIQSKASTTSTQTKENAKYGVRIVAPVHLIQFNKDCVKAHNDYRRSHYAPAMRLNERLRRFAQEWSDVLARNEKIEHRPDNYFGENIYACEGFEPTGFRTAQRWYQEMVNYDFGHPSFSPQTGHFTQMVWRASRQIGVGIARGNSGNYYVVANYDPPGNVINHYKENVLPRGSNLPEELHKLPFIERIQTIFRPFDRFQRECLQKHNECRARHDAPPLRLSVELCRNAQDWAQTLAAENQMRSQGNVRYGENIYSIKATDVVGSMPVASWYEESGQYNGKYAPGTGHFTQIVWVATVELGVGVARSRTGEVYVVANYYPPGNIQDENEKNVRMWRK